MDMPIIILHGWDSKIKRWRNFQEQMEKKGFLTFLPSLPGFGKSQLKEVWSLDDYVSWLEKYIAINQFKKFYLLGHSFGGQVAIKFSSLRPKGLEKLILVNSAGMRKKLSLKKLLFWVLAKTGKIFFYIPPFLFFRKPAQWLLYKLVRERDYYQASQIMKKTLKKVLQQDVSKSLKKIKAPTLIVWGENDKKTPLSDGLLINSKIRKSKLVVIKGTGHGLPFEKTDLLVAQIESFIFE